MVWGHVWSGEVQAQVKEGEDGRIAEARVEERQPKERTQAVNPGMELAEKVDPGRWESRVYCVVWRRRLVKRKWMMDGR